MLQRQSLSSVLAEQLRARIKSKEWKPGEQMPTEFELAAAHSVSRTTVRQAIKVLEGQGLVIVRHGRGTFVADGRTIHAGLQDLRSITNTVAAQGHLPGMKYRSKDLRTAGEDERHTFGLAEDALVLAVERAILADGLTVAYSYDTVVGWALPPEFDPAELTGSVFDFLERSTGVTAVRAIAELHAVQSESVGWGDDPDDQLYLLLDQLHYDELDRPFMHSRSYFVEGRFNFDVQRTT